MELVVPVDKAIEFIESVLKHDGQQRIYDPRKAHEYYLRTRELKGRRPALKTQSQKEGFAYVKSEVAKNKSFETFVLSAQNKAKMDSIKTDIKKRKDELSAKLKGLAKGLPKDASKAERAKIAEERAKLADEFKSSIEKTRADFKTAIEGMKAKYETQLDTEYNALKSMKTKRSRR